MAINAEIPEDVLILILSRLPVKSLLRFKSVSKYWYSLIQTPSFISLHNTISRNNDSLLIKLDFQFSRSLFCDFSCKRRRSGFYLFGYSKYSIGPILGRYVAMGIRRNGELLLLWVNERHMVSYKLDTQNIKEYHNVVDDPVVIPFRVLSYAENLVSVKRQCLAS